MAASTASAIGPPLLEVRGLKVRYGVIEALHGVDLAVARGEIVTVIGANGAGKTTLLKTISGLVPVAEGAVVYNGACELTRLKPHQIVARGIGHVPEGRRIFQNLSVRENLSLGAYLRSDRREIDPVERLDHAIANLQAAHLEERRGRRARRRHRASSPR